MLVLLLRAFINLVNPRLQRYSRPGLLAVLIFALTLVGFIIINIALNVCTITQDVQHMQHQGSWTAGQLEFISRQYNEDTWDAVPGLTAGYELKRTHVCIDSPPYELKTFPHPEQCDNFNDAACTTHLVRPELCIMNTERLRDDNHPESAAQRFYRGDWSIEDCKSGCKTGGWSFGPPPPSAPASYWGYCNTSLPFWMRTTVLADRGNPPEPANWAFPPERLNCGQRGGTGYDAGNSMTVFEDMKADGPGSEEYIETAVFVQYKITTQRKTCPAASTAAGAALGYWAAVEVAFTILVVIVLGATGLINEPDGAGKLGLKGLAKSGSRAATAKPATTEDMAKLRADIMAALEGKQPTKPAEGATSTTKEAEVVVEGV